MNSIQRFRKLLYSQTAIDTLTVLGGSGISSALGFIFIFIVARQLGPTQFGIFSTLVNYFVFLSAVVDLGISQSLVRFVQESKNDTEKKIWLSTALAVVTITTLLLSVLATVLYHAFLRDVWGHVGGFTLLVFLSIFVITINIFFLGFFQSLRQFLYRSLLDASFSVIRIIIIVLALIYSTITIFWGMWSIVLSYVIVLVMAFVIGRKYLSFDSIKLSKVSTIFKFSRWVAGVNFFANLYGKLDVMMLAWLSSAYMTGIYSAAARFILIFPLMVSSLSSVISSRFASFTNIFELNSYFKKSLGVVGGFSLVMSILILVAEPIIIIPYSEAFRQSVPIFRLLVLANIPLIISIPATNAIIYYFKKPQFVTAIVFIQLIGLLILNMLLVPLYDAMGPVYSLLAMNAFGMVGMYGLYIWLYKRVVAQSDSKAFFGLKRMLAKLCL